MRKLFAYFLVLLLLVGCHLAPPSSNPTNQATVTAAGYTQPAPPLKGRVSFGARLVQAAMVDVVGSATVALINTGTNQTVTTALTDDSGNFVLNFSNGYVADPTATYYLEALKGLNSNQPGSFMARVRTIAKYSNGWTSLSNTTPNTGIVINPSSTALAIGAALRNGNPSPFDFASLIGSLTGDSADTFAGITNLSSSDFTSLRTLVSEIVTDDRDPVANIGLVSSTTWIRLNVTPSITSTNPTSGTVGTSVTITGVGFSPVAANNTVKFNGVSATVTSASATSLVTTIPSGATSGALTLRVGSVTVLGPGFSVIPTLTSFTPDQAYPGSSVTLTGSGFDGSVAANNVVLVNEVPATVISANSTSIVFTVPRGSTSGPLKIKVAGQSATSTNDFEVVRTIRTIAGVNQVPPGLRATTWPIYMPLAVAVDAWGNTFFSSGQVVYRLDSSGGLYVVAGTELGGYTGDNGAATDALLNNPSGVAVDGAGNLYIADSYNHRIRKVNTSGIITTVAGTGTEGYAGDNGAATDAVLYFPSGVAVDGAGNLYIADSGNYCIRKVNTSGIITTVAGNGTPGNSADNVAATSVRLNDLGCVSVDGAGNLYIAERGSNRIRKVNTSGIITTVAGNGAQGYSGDNGAATSASLYSPYSMTVDSSGNLYLADGGNHRIRKVDTNGIITTVAGTGTRGYAGDNGAATSAQLSDPLGLGVDSAGNLFFADYGNGLIRKVDTSGIITTVAGTGSWDYTGDNGAATIARLNYPRGIAVDGLGNLYITDEGNHRIRKVNTSGIITTVAGNGTPGYAGDNGAASSARLNCPSGVTVDDSGNLYIADLGNHRIRKVDTHGLITTVAGNGTQGYAGDDGAATNARLNCPLGVAVDGAGNLYIADVGNYRIRKVETSGTITTVAGTGTWGYGGDNGPATNAMLVHPHSLAVDGSGNLYIADDGNHRIRKVNTNGIITTVAGTGTDGYAGDNGAATGAMLYGPSGVAVDGSGNVYIADTGNQRIRKVNTSGIITTVAGNGTHGYAGDDGAATSAMLRSPTGVAVDGSGTLYIADYNNNRIRCASF